MLIYLAFILLVGVFLAALIVGRQRSMEQEPDEEENDPYNWYNDHFL